MAESNHGRTPFIPRNRARSFLGGNDKIFLHTDEPENPMNIAGLWRFSKLPSLDAIKAEFLEMIERYPRFAHRLNAESLMSGNYRYEEYADFNLDEHVVTGCLGEDGIPATEQEAVAQILSTSLDRSKALWMSYIVSGLPDGGGFVLTQMHHCLSDGQGSIRALLTLTSRGGVVGAQANARKPRPPPTPSQRVMKWISMPLLLPWYILMTVVGVLRIMIKQAQIMLMRRKTLTWEQTAQKEVAWSTPLRLADVKAIRVALQRGGGGGVGSATVNDVLVGVLSSAMRRFLLEQTNPTTGCPYTPQEMESDLLAGIPISMRGAKDFRLNNQACMLWLWLPVNQPSAVKAIAAVHRRMSVLKSSPEPWVNYLILLVSMWIPRNRLLDAFMHWFMSRAHCICTNVPGPQEQLIYAGEPIRDYLPFIPQPGRGGLGLGILSYNGIVHMTALSDAGKCRPGAQRLMDLVNQEFDALLQQVTAGRAAATAGAVEERKKRD